MTMRPDLHADVVRRLQQDYGFKPKGNWLQQGKCPECKGRELYTKADSPWVLWCGRKNKCGAEIHVKEIYRDLFENWSERYPATEVNPHAAADAYLMHARAFPLKRLEGTYSQEWYQDRERNIGTATVRFPLPNGSWWERLIDRPERFGKMKARFAPKKSMHGHWWALPDSAADAGEIWLTEGIFDTVALELAGVTSRALLSCNNYPEHALSELAKACTEAGRERPRLVWALDDGAAGKLYMRKWHERATEEGWKSRAAYTPDQGALKQDWNELWMRGRLDANARDEALYQGDLLLAPSAMAKALLMYKHDARASFHFGYADRLFWFDYNDAKYRKAREALDAKDETTDLSEEEKRDRALAESGTVAELANCYPQALYYQANAQTDESWYYYRVSFPHRGAPIKNTFTASQLSSASEFKKRLLAIAPGAVFTGTTFQLDRLFKHSLFSIKTVETIDFVGYSRQHGCYVLGDVAVRDGQVYVVNEEDYFDLGKKLAVKSLNQSVGLTINRLQDEYNAGWLDMVWECFGAKGIVALAFWFGSLFAEQIRAKQKSYPFLEIIGEAGSGKSTLVEFLWKLVGRSDYEGFDPSKSTMAARARNFAQVSNLPVVLIEGDRETDTAKQKSFDWNELKTAYNGRSVRATGVKNSGNETREPPFRGSIVIAQNAEVSASDAILQRIVHLSFDKASHTSRTSQLAKQLERMPVEQVSGFVLRAAQREAKVMEVLEANAGDYAEQLLRSAEIKSVRVAKNHGQMMALVDGLRDVVGLTEAQWAAAHAALFTMAVERQVAINADHPYVQAFWELFDHLNGSVRDTESGLDHSRNADYIAVNLVEFEARVHRAGLSVPGGDMTELKKKLSSSRHRKFYAANKAINSFITSSTKKCWVFKREAGE